jgi:hypothetical protein
VPKVGKRLLTPGIPGIPFVMLLSRHLVLSIKPFSAKAAQKQQEAQVQYDSIHRKKAAEKITKGPALQHQGHFLIFYHSESPYFSINPF